MINAIRQWLITRRLRKQLADSDFEMAKGILVKNFADKLIRKELAELLDSFIDKPCLENALKLVTFDPMFITYFSLARRGGFTQSLFRSGKIK